MIEDDELAIDLSLAASVPALQRVSYDLTLTPSLALADGSTATALEIQWQFLTMAKKWSNSHGFENGPGDIGADVLVRWEAVLTALEADPDSLRGLPGRLDAPSGPP